MPLMTYDDLLTTANDLVLELNNVSHLLDYWKDRALKAEQLVVNNLATCEQTTPVVITTVVDDSFAAKLQAAIDEAKHQQSIYEQIADLNIASVYPQYPQMDKCVGKPQNNSEKSDTQWYAETVQANAQSVSENSKTQDTLKRKPIAWSKINVEQNVANCMGIELFAFKDKDGTYNASCIVPMRRPEYAKNFATLDDAKQYAETVMLERVIRHYFEKG